MPLKYDSMPKITFCFKDYLELRRIIFALQALPALETHVCWVSFPRVSALTVQGGKRRQSVNELEMLPLKKQKKTYIYKLGFIIYKYFLPFLLFCLKQIKYIYMNNSLNGGHAILLTTLGQTLISEE